MIAALLVDYVQVGVMNVGCIHSRLCALDLMWESGPPHAVMVIAFHPQSFFEIPVALAVLCKLVVGTLMM